jgi:hypothetical protein
MKPKEISKEIFGLSVRLLGLVFLYLGLKDAPIVMNVPTLMGEEKSDIVAEVLPVVFNLVVACWLLRSSMLIRWAYPEAPKIQEHFHPAAERAAAAQTAQPQVKDLDAAEKKLASLLAKPKDDRAA